MSNIFMSTENSKTSDPNIFTLYFTDKIGLRGSYEISQIQNYFLDEVIKKHK